MQRKVGGPKDGQRRHQTDVAARDAKNDVGHQLHLVKVYTHLMAMINAPRG